MIFVNFSKTISKMKSFIVFAIVNKKENTYKIFVLLDDLSIFNW